MGAHEETAIKGALIDLGWIPPDEVRAAKHLAWSEGHQDGWSDRGHPGEDQTRSPYL